MLIQVFCILYLVGFTLTKTNEPQVYEDIDDSSQIRVAREGFNQKTSKVFKPQSFDYQKSTQQDQTKNRYALQQRTDIANMIKRRKDLKMSLAQKWKVADPTVATTKTEENHAPTEQTKLKPQKWKVADPTVAASKIEEKYSIPEETKNSNVSNSIWNKIAQLSTRNKSISSRKLKPSSYYEDLDNKTTIERQDQNGQVIYVEPEFIKQQFNEHDLKALNALVGKHPHMQLEGLKKLLESESPNYILPSVIKSKPPYIPVAEASVDVPQYRAPSIKINPGPGVNIEAIQAQLDEHAKINIQKALAKAQQEAIAHVEAQQKAIALAQVDARRKALEEIERHNNAIKAAAEPLPQPLAQVALQKGFRPSPIPQPVAIEIKTTSVPINLYQHQRPRPQIRVHATALPRNLYTAQGHETKSTALPTNLYHQGKETQAVKHQIQVQTTAIPLHLYHQQVPVQTTAVPVKTIKYHQAHTTAAPVNFYHHGQGQAQSFIKIEHNGNKPKSHQEVVEESQHNTQKFYPAVKHQQLIGEDEHHQYASRYAFGYKIRDVKMGNEFGHEEKREGKSAKGVYHVLLPDGRLQKVEYYADPTGYHAKVSYETLAHH